MRVIAGSARRIPLVTPRGADTRPTTDRIKETLFNILYPLLLNARFLDLFAGSGGIGIEALSRGAGKAVFIEDSREACDCIRTNLEKTHLADRAVLLSEPVLSGLMRLEAGSSGEKGAFDIIFMDPPYGKGMERRVLAALRTSPLADQNTLIIVEAKAEEDFSYAGETGFQIEREKVYGSNKHVFLKKI